MCCTLSQRTNDKENVKEECAPLIRTHTHTIIYSGADTVKQYTRSPLLLRVITATAYSEHKIYPTEQINIALQTTQTKLKTNDYSSFFGIRIEIWIIRDFTNAIFWCKNKSYTLILKLTSLTNTSCVCIDARPTLWQMSSESPIRFMWNVTWSQYGWKCPLKHSRNNVFFVLFSFGMSVIICGKPSETK